jgi:hypothetical protein
MLSGGDLSEYEKMKVLPVEEFLIKFDSFVSKIKSKK